MSRVFFASQSRRKLTIATLCAAVLAVSGCETIGGTKTADTSLKANPTATEQLAAVQEVFNANAEQVPTLTAVGYAVVSQVDSSTTVIDLMVQNDTFRGVVSGTIRGARTVRINPTGSDTYEIVLEIDRDMIGHLISTARGIA